MDGLHGHGKALNRREVYIFTFHDVISSSLDSHVIATGSFDTCGPPPAWHAILCLRRGSVRPIVAKWDGKNFGAVGEESLCRHYRYPGQILDKEKFASY